MCVNDPFLALMDRLRAGDQDAATQVYGRFVRQLIAMVGRQFHGAMRERVDVEDVVQSAYRSFFRRQAQGEFALAGWDDLWALLSAITLRKCAKRRDKMRAARRDASREVYWPEGWEPCDLDREPSPVEAATLADLVEHLFRSLEPDDRQIVEQILMGYTADEIAERLDCSERTVRRVRHRAKFHLGRLIAPDENAS
jgi:RNA polymerase sigma-70 factor (ECF subfamily)